MKCCRKYIVILAMIAFCSCTNTSNIDGKNVKDNPANSESSALASTNEPVVTSEIVNPFFFQNGESVISYNGLFAVGMEGEILECNVNLHIINLGQYQDGNLYNIKIDPDGSALGELLNSDSIWSNLDYWTERLNLGYLYVDAEKIYMLSATDKMGMTIVGKIEPPECYITCQNEELKDTLDVNEKVWHNFIRVDGNKRESHFYNMGDYSALWAHPDRSLAPPVRMMAPMWLSAHQRRQFAV